MNVAIQGIKGSFHEIAAKQFFGPQIGLKECLSFTEIPKLINDNEVDFGIMAIENSIAGAILPNYALIDEYELAIKGEIFLNIHHHLMALPNQTLEDIKEVWSHPMAILQCRKFFRAHPHIKLIEEKDTAEVAQKIQQKQLKGIAAIASKAAAELFGLDIVKDDIQTIKNNSTRFFILSKQNNQNDKNLELMPNKASLKFITQHETGSLAEVLDIFAKHDISLSKIQSLPIIDKPWHYAFFIDLNYDDTTLYNNALHLIKKKVAHLKVLGEYERNVLAS